MGEIVPSARQFCPNAYKTPPAINQLQKYQTMTTTDKTIITTEGSATYCPEDNKQTTMNEPEYIAIVNEDETGPALGVGTSVEAAWYDAGIWGIKDRDGCKAVGIRRETYEAIRAGNPDAPR